MKENEEEVQQAEEGEAYFCKIILIGDSGVGKTSIINKFKQDSYLSIQEETRPTDLPKFNKRLLQIGKEKINFEIWDTCGQEQYRCVTRLVYKGSDIVIFVYDITNEKSLDSLNDFWLKDVQDNVDNEHVIYGVVGNKNDLLAQKDIEEKARKFAEDNGAVFGITSAKTTFGIEDIFRQLGIRYLGIMERNKEKAKKAKEKNQEEEEQGKEEEKEKAKGLKKGENGEKRIHLEESKMTGKKARQKGCC